MADRIIKSDSGNDTVIQNNSGSRKIEVTNSGDVEVTGDFKATTVKATNLKANDGTAGLVVADSTGEVTSSGGIKAVNVKTTNLKANDGTASLEIADSTGDIGFSGNTNLKFKLPSAGGIYESDGSTEVLTESSGTVSLKNTSLNANNIFPSGHVIQTVVSQNKTDGTPYDPATVPMEITVGSSSNDVVGYFFTHYLYTSSSGTPYISGIDTGDTYARISSGHSGFWAMHFIDTSPTSGSNTYTLQGYSFVDYLCAAGGYGYGYVLQEIKR